MDCKFFINRPRFAFVISNSLDTSTPWIIATNKDIEHAVCNYSYRFNCNEKFAARGISDNYSSASYS